MTEEQGQYKTEIDDAPKYIYIQNYGSDEPTWCEDQINEEDIEYILKSEFDKAMQIIGEMRLKTMIDGIMILLRYTLR